MLEGSCLCGQVRYALAGGAQFINHCHCSMCRKAHGAAFGSFVHAAGRGFQWLSGQALVTQFQSSPDSLRAFCSVCGSNLPVLEDDGRHVIIPAGGLDGDPGLRPAVHIHVASMAPWHRIGDDLPQFADDAPDEFWRRLCADPD